MMGRHVESEAWGGMRRVGRRYLSCSALAAMAFQRNIGRGVTNRDYVPFGKRRYLGNK